MLGCCCYYHRSNITAAAIVTTIFAFLSSVGHWWGLVTGLIALVLVLLTICYKVPQPLLYGATVAAFICWISNIVEAINLNCDPNDGENLSCDEEHFYRVFAIIASLLWIAAVGLIVSIPTRDPDTEPSASEKEKDVDDLKLESE